MREEWGFILRQIEHSYFPLKKIYEMKKGGVGQTDRKYYQPQQHHRHITLYTPFHFWKENMFEFRSDQIKAYGSEIYCFSA